MQIAISKGDNMVSIWCEVTDRDSDGTIHFDVINGAWSGWINGDEVYVFDTTRSHFGNKIVWQGKAPFSEWKYNEAIAWIQESVDRNGGRLVDYIYIEPSKQKVCDCEDDIPF